MKVISKKLPAVLFLLFSGWCLLSSVAWGQGFDSCVQNINNATVVVPASVQAVVSGEAIEAGDEIAVFTADGTCVGHGIWNDESLSIAAAGVDSQTPDGYRAGESLQFRVWDASSSAAYEANVAYTPCADGDPLCKDDGQYEHNVLYSIEQIETITTLGDDLPVELVTFEATVHGSSKPSSYGSQAVLEWETASETANAGFEVQHQAPQAAEGTWKNVGFVEGHGTTSKTHRYTHRLEDLKPGTHTFRLKQMDLDGSVAYSASVEAVVELAGSFDIVAPYPNPFRQRATFTLTVAETQRVDVAAYNQLGQRVATLHDGELAPDTQHTFRLEADRLSSGMYFIQIRGEEFNAMERAILVR